MDAKLLGCFFSLNIIEKLLSSGYYQCYAARDLLQVPSTFCFFMEYWYYFEHTFKQPTTGTIMFHLKSFTRFFNTDSSVSCNEIIGLTLFTFPTVTGLSLKSISLFSLWLPWTLLIHLLTSAAFSRTNRCLQHLLPKIEVYDL